MSTDASPPWNVPPTGPGAGTPRPMPPMAAVPVSDSTSTAPGAMPPAAVPVQAFPARVAVRQVAVPAVSLLPNPSPPLVNAADRLRRPRRDPFRGRRKFWVSLATSTLVHCILVVVAGLIAAGGRPPERPTLYASFTARKPQPIETLNTVRSANPQAPRAPIQVEKPDQTASRIVSEATGRIGETRRDDVAKMPTYSPGNFGVGELLTDVGGSPYGMLDGRDGPLKTQLLEDATPESEQAVYRGLKWLAAHQRDDGGWNFDHRQTGCKYCANPGTHGSMTAATGLALLPFLGAGHTHKKAGEFQETVRKGLEFLKGRVKLTPLGGDLQDGVNLYSQAIATLALCEAFAMTDDRDLQQACSEAVRFIVNAQHKPGGGWRYFPGQVGDTTVTGWMLMALKSAQLNYVGVPSDVWPNAKHFLDTVQDDGGAAYGYQSPEKDRVTMTAIGLLCRMYGGWPRHQEALGRGVRAVGRKGPSKTDLYFDYYATQTLRHYGGSEWHTWNRAMRDFLVESQEERGHMSGSWYFPDQHGDQGGRVYNTAMAVLILEVYYRHLPIYGFRAVGEGFRGR